MTYNHQLIRQKLAEDRFPGHFGGPWKADPWFNPHSWRHWKRFNNISVVWEEAYTEINIAASGPDYTEGGLSETKYVREKTFRFTAAVGPGDIWRSDAPLPEGMSKWLHGSSTAYGSGLYDARGQISIFGQVHSTHKLTSIFTPDGGAPDTNVEFDTFEDYDTTQTLVYATDPAKPVLGRNTFCRMILEQVFHGPYAAVFSPYVEFPREKDPDGNEFVPGTDPPIPAKEVYFTDLALLDLANGSFSGETVQNGGSIRRNRGPNAGGIDNGDFDEQSYTRSGSVAIGFS